MTEQQRKTRPPTPAEIHAARALGLVEPVEIVDDVTPTADLHAARLSAPRKSAKPAGMQTADYYGQRVRERNAAERAAQAAARGAEEDDEEPEEAEETEPEEQRLAGGSWGAGRRAMRTDNGAIVG